MVDGPVTHWIDTNVMLEVYSDGDLQSVAESHERGEASLADLEEGRLRIQGSLWMAMALSILKAHTITFEHENYRNIQKLAPPGSARGGWTATILYMLGDHGVFDGWTASMTNDGESLSNRDRDRHMVKECATDKLVLVTRDEKVIREAQAAGVDVARPEAFAARYITREDARRMFEGRVRNAAWSYLVAGPSWEHEMRMQKGQEARQLLEVVWRSPSTPVFK